MGLEGINQNMITIKVLLAKSGDVRSSIKKKQSKQRMSSVNSSVARPREEINRDVAQKKEEGWVMYPSIACPKTRKMNCVLYNKSTKKHYSAAVGEIVEIKRDNNAKGRSPVNVDCCDRTNCNVQ